MNLEKKSTLLYTSLYVIFSLLILYVLLIEYNDGGILEIIFKVTSLMLLSFLYLNNVSRVNFYYVLILLIYIVSDSLLTFGNVYVNKVISILLINKFLYMIIISEVFRRNSLRSIVAYTIPHFITGSIIYYLFSSALDYFNIYIFLVYIFLVIIGGLSFVNLIDKDSLKTRLYFIGIFLISIGEVIIAISLFIESNIFYVISYYILCFIGRYLIFRSMIRKR